MRRVFDGLSAQVRTVLQHQRFSGNVFVFRVRRGDIVKLLQRDVILRVLPLKSIINRANRIGHNSLKPSPHHPFHIQCRSGVIGRRSKTVRWKAGVQINNLFSRRQWQWNLH